MVDDGSQRIAAGNDRYSIRSIAADDWLQLEPMWRALYDHQRLHGLLVSLPSDAYQLWVDALRPLLGRFAFVYVAEWNESLVGFLSGKIRSLPPHFGGEAVGFLGELFVAPLHRDQGIASKLLETAHVWFMEGGIKRVELQVLSANAEAREFYGRRGWTEELLQLVWLEPDQNSKENGAKQN